MGLYNKIASKTLKAFISLAINMAVSHIVSDVKSNIQNVVILLLEFQNGHLKNDNNAIFSVLRHMDMIFVSKLMFSNTSQVCLNNLLGLLELS